MEKKLIRLPDVLSSIGGSRSKTYSDIKKKIFPPQIQIGRRAVAWLLSEVNAWINAVAAGASENDLRELVANLVAQRQATSIFK